MNFWTEATAENKQVRKWKDHILQKILNLLTFFDLWVHDVLCCESRIIISVNTDDESKKGPELWFKQSPPLYRRELWVSRNSRENPGWGGDTILLKKKKKKKLNAWHLWLYAVIVFKRF